MDAFSTLVIVFSTNSTFERDDAPVDLKTTGSAGGSQCIVA